MNLNLHLYSSNDLEFQSATNCSHTGLCDVLEKLGNPLNPELYFVVPDRIFSSVTYQNYLEKDGDVLSKKGIVGSIQKLSQFVLTFESPSK